jgi:sortase A
MMQARLLTRIGTFLLGSGALLIAFVAFQLWGTALYTDHTQSSLKNELSHEIGHTSLPLSSLKSAKPGSDPKGSGIPVVATAVAPTTRAPAVGQPLGLLAIPKLGLDDALVEGTGEPQLQGGPGHYVGTSLPGQAGNAAIAGHRTTFAAPFYNLNQLVPGDPIFVLTSQGLFRYNVVRSFIVSPNDNAVLDAATTPELTLTTCNPRYSASQRLVVVADLDTTPGSAVPPTKPNAGGKPKTSTTTSPTVTKAAAAAAASGKAAGVWPAILWGLITLVAAVIVRLAARRFRRPLSWVSYVVGVPLVLVALVVCFEHVSLALPSSF